MPKGRCRSWSRSASQHVTLYSNGVRVAQAPVSTGIPGHPTPTGVFSIIQKDRYHHSNLYSNAPMYYMHRITWSGVAMHEGVLPGVPGLARLHPPADELRLEALWQVTKLGVRVIVARTDVAPHDFEHPKLFDPKAEAGRHAKSRELRRSTACGRRSPPSERTDRRPAIVAGVTGDRRRSPTSR